MINNLNDKYFLSDVKCTDAEPSETFQFDSVGYGEDAGRIDRSFF